MSTATTIKRKQILSAARAQFSQYGFQRTSMDDIARESGFSRASLYSYFKNKEEIFKSLAEALYETAILSARSELQAVAGNKALADRLFNCITAFYAEFYSAIEGTPHGAEIIEIGSRLNGGVATVYAEKLESLLAAELRQANKNGEIDCKAAGVTAPVAAEMIRLSLIGLKQGATDFALFKKRLGKFLTVFVAGLG